MSDGNLPPAITQQMRSVLPSSVLDLQIKGFVRFEISSNDTDVDQLYKDLEQDAWQRLPSDGTQVIQVFRTTASSFFLMLTVLPEPIVFAPTVVDPNDDAWKSFTRLGSIGVEVRRDPKTYPIEIRTRLQLKYTEALPPIHMTLKDSLPAIQIRPEDVVYVGPPIVTPAGSFKYPVVSYDLVGLDVSENRIAGALRESEVLRN